VGDLVDTELRPAIAQSWQRSDVVGLPPDSTLDHLVPADVDPQSSLLAAQNRALFSFGLFAVAGEVACLVTAILALPAALFFAESLKKSDKSPRGIATRHATR